MWDRECLEIAYSRIYGVLRHEGPAAPSRPKGLGVLEERILGSLQASPCPAGELAAAFGAPVASVTRKLSMLELDGRVVRLRDGRYSLSEREFLSHNSYRT